MFCCRTFLGELWWAREGDAEALDNMVISLAKLPVANPADFAGERKCMHFAGYTAAPKNSSWL